MRISRKLAALSAFFVLAAAIIAGCGGSSSGHSVGRASVASMAGNQIPLRAYKHWMYVAAKGSAAQESSTSVIVASDPPKFTGCIKQVRVLLPSLAKTSDKALQADCAQLFTTENTEVMQFLIDAYWYQADAYRAGIRLSPKQSNAAFVKAKKAQFPTAKEYKAFLAESGQTDADIRFRVRVNTLYAKLLKRYTKKVTNADVAAYYKAHASEFSTPQTRDIHIALTKTQATAAAALAALKSGQSWDTVAEKYSTDASTKTNGGLLTGIEKGEEEHALDTVAFSSPVGKLEGPVKGTFGWYVVEVAKITPATHESLATATKTIKSELVSQRQVAAENKVTKLSEKKWGKKTTCAKRFAIVTYCANYVAPKTTTTTAASSTSAAGTSTASATGSSTSSAATSASTSTAASTSPTPSTSTTPSTTSGSTTTATLTSTTHGSTSTTASTSTTK